MDAIVEAALRKWPNVPACRGWLGLDARGHWYLRDAQVQSAGPFPAARGSRIEHEKLLAFIGRNYEADGEGAWFFQNGPQRVYVELEAAPWVLGVQRLDGARFGLQTHTGLDFGAPRQLLLDEQGRLFLAGAGGLGLLRSQDMAVAADAIEQGVWPTLQEVRFEELPERFGFRLRPSQAC